MPTPRLEYVRRIGWPVTNACDESAENVLQMAPSADMAIKTADFPTPRAFILAPMVRQYHVVLVIRLRSAEHDVPPP